MMIKHALRRFHLGKRIYNLSKFAFVDNAPKQNDNEEWFRTLKSHGSATEEKMAAVTLEGEPFESYSLLVIPPNAPPIPIDQQYLLVDLKYRIMGEDPLNTGLVDVGMTMKDYFLGAEYSQLLFARFHGGSSRVGQARRIEQKTFVDLKVVELASGDGGQGCVSFSRDAHQPVGPPDGGDGGDGGDVYVRVVEGSSLHKIKKSYKAFSGSSGGSAQLDGKRGQDVVIDVPVGTTIRWIPDMALIRKTLSEASGHMENTELKIKVGGDMLDEIQLFRQTHDFGEGWIFKDKQEEYFSDVGYFELLKENMKVYERELLADERMKDRVPLLGWDFDEPSPKPKLLLKGGRGGMGNMHFLTSDIRNPRFSKKGRNGVKGTFLLELKLIADLGLVGLPNAGKSTLLRAISKARPRVGHWEFTTLQPTIGTIPMAIDEEPFTVADIPGIISGARENKGMGLDFLRHIERLGGLVFVVSMESEDPIADLKVLETELGPKTLRGKKVLVVATKADLSDGNTYGGFRKMVEDRGWKIVPVCAPQGENIEQCIKLMGETAKKEEYVYKW